MVFFSELQCYIETQFCQKLTLKFSLSHGDILSKDHVNISTQSLQNLLRRHKIRVPPTGTIEDKGKRRYIRLFIYKIFDTVRCSAASASDFNLVDISAQLITPPIRITRNVAWSF